MGDFHFLSITWYSGYGSIKAAPTYGSVLNASFLDLINDASVEQFVHSPTHLNNLLDLVFCTYPKINNLSTVPGISDHDAITFHFDINKHPTSSVKQHKVSLYHRGNAESVVASSIC